MKRFTSIRLSSATILAVVLLLIGGCRHSYYEDVFSTDNFKSIVSIREEARLTEQMLQEKIETFLPELMRQEGINMWIVTRSDRSVYPSLMPAEDGLITFSPFFMVFYDDGGTGGIEQIAVGNMNSFKEWGRLYPDQAFTLEESLEKLAGIVKAHDPQKIAIGAARNANFEAALGSRYVARLISAENIRNRWIEYRTPREIEAFKTAIDISHDLIAEMFSNKAVTPDVTTTTDLDFWMRQKVTDLGLDDQFGPTVMVWRSLEENKKYGDPEDHFRIDIPPHCGNNNIIRRGDVISCDFGIAYLGVLTDIQQVAYVLKEGETDVPEGLKEAMRRGNRLQDIFASEWKQGLTGNEILFASLERAIAEELRPEIYSHPLGSFPIRFGFKGGAASKNSASWGPSFGSEGSFDAEGNQRPTRSGERVLNYNTTYAMELDITYALPEWGGQDVRIVLEEDVAFTEEGCIYPGGRQTEWHIIE